MTSSGQTDRGFKISESETSKDMLMDSSKMFRRFFYESRFLKKAMTHDYQ